jgi:transglutaminase-like putative cysteine protease
MRFLFTTVFLLFISLIGFAQDNYDVDLIPANLRNRANACIRNEETTIDMRSPDNVMLNVKKAITVFNQNGEDEARLVIYYDKNISIKAIKGEVYNSVGKLINKFSQNDFADMSAADGFSLFVDSRVKHYLPSVNQYPYTLVYNYEIRNKQNLIIPDWNPKLADDVSVEKSSYTFICKPTDQIRIKTQNYNGAPEVTTDEKQKKTIWKVSNILAVRTEPYSPSHETYTTSIQIAPQDFYYYNHKGNYTNWQELGKWIYDDLLKERKALPPATIQMVKDLVKNEKTDKEKARKIYQYLQDKTRYISVQIGIGGFQPIAASEVDRLGYGDCKALVNYMQSLLSAADIDSYYCVVEAGSEKKSMDPKYASMVQGNHIILCMPLKGDTTWLECTSQKIPFGFLSDFTDDRLVLACTPEGGKLLHTPKLTTTENLQTRKATLTIQADGSVAGKMNTVYAGSQYENQESLIGKSITEQHKLLKEAYNIDNIDFETVTFAQKKDIAPKLTEDITINIRNYAPVNGNKMFLQLNAFNVKRSIPEIRNRTLPVYINRGYTDEDTIVYILPDNVNPELIIGQNKTFKSAFGEYVCKANLEGNKLTYYRKFVLNDGTFPAEQYSEFSKFINDVNSADYLKLALSLKK